VGFSLGAPIDAAVRGAAALLTDRDAWYPAISADGGISEGAWVAEATELVDLSKWPLGTRLILRKERPVRREALLIRTEVRYRRRRSCRSRTVELRAARSVW
jgi:hypothetical protein